MVKELFGSDKETERRYNYFGNSGQIDTIVGSLKKGIAKDVLGSFNSKHQENAMSYLRGEVFIDALVDRINKKQLSQTGR